MNSERIKEIALQYNLDLVILFGSQARGNTHKHSDIDIAIKADHKLSLTELVRLQSEFYRVFERSDVEIVDLQNASPILLREISREGKVLYARVGDEFARLRMYTFKIFVETKPLREYQHKHLEDFVKNYG